LSLDGAITFQDVRNASAEGTFADFAGDRIPNRPWLLASWGARLRIANLPRLSDVLEPFYAGRYVHPFFRGWESQGLRAFKQVVDAQLTHDVGVTYSMGGQFGRVSATLEIQNATNAAVFDFFGVQRPGRAFFFKITGAL
jgi:vitamin B12 transporter